jgi:hypothetical protein
MKTLNLTFLSILVLSLFASCKKKSTEIYAHVDIKVLNHQGLNLLNAPAVYDKNNIEVYHVKNGIAQLYVQPPYNAGAAFILIKDADGKDGIRVFLDYKKDEPTSLTLVKFGNTKIDTIKANFRFDGSSVFCEQVWFNGVPKPQAFEIVK